LFDLFSNFTFFLNDPENGGAIQQHDSRLQEGANAQYLRPHKLLGAQSLLTAGGNFHDNQINVGLYPRIGRVPLGVTTRANAHVTNGAGYIQESVNLFAGKLLLGGGLRYDVFRFDVRDRVDPINSAAETSGRIQPKFSLAYTPTRRFPVTLHANYGRGISSIDARSIIQSPGGTKLATTDFHQVGVSSQSSRFSVAADLFLIDRSNELVYVADDGTLEFLGPSRALNHYRLDGEDPSIVAAGHSVLDFSLVRRIRQGLDFSFAVDNLTDRSYYETQNYIESRPYRDVLPAFGIHATPGYPLTVTVGLTFRFRGK
jgi:outer membrane receptor protein involved in Fe transport